MPDDLATPEIERSQILEQLATCALVRSPLSGDAVASHLAIAPSLTIPAMILSSASRAAWRARP